MVLLTLPFLFSLFSLAVSSSSVDDQALESHSQYGPHTPYRESLVSRTYLPSLRARALYPRMNAA